MTKLVGAFCNFANAPKNGIFNFKSCAINRLMHSLRTADGCNCNLQMSRIQTHRTRKIAINCLIIIPTRCTNFSNVFWTETLHVSDSSSVHHKELLILHSAMVYVIQVCRQHSSRIRMEHPDPAQ
jgi:hypothetical protein